MTCGDGTYWRAIDSDTGVPGYQMCIHGMDSAGNCVPPVGVTALTRDDVDALGVRFTLTIIEYVRDWHAGV